MIENAYALHPAVALAAAVGQPDAYAGELPCVYLTLKPGAEATLEQLRAFGVAHIGERAAVPAYLELRAQLPLTAVGKIFKPDLRCWAAERVLSDALAGASIAADVVAHFDPLSGLVVTIRVAGKVAAARAVAATFSIRTEVLAKQEQAHSALARRWPA